jgi:23S rRNA pseudouridine2605 synthase
LSEERIAKFIARCGVCSRRDAERLIDEGRVKVNSKRLDTPAFKVSANDVVEVDGQIIQAFEEVKIWLFYKPRGVITSSRDPQGRTTVFDILPEDMPRVITIGRLDYNTEGLLLLTNSGEFARKMELPSSEVVREYRVRIDGKLLPEVVHELKAGVTIDGISYRGIEVENENTKEKGLNTWIKMRLKEGKNREIRRVLEHFGYQVSRLIRTKYGQYSLGTMIPGEVRSGILTKK